MIHWAWLIPAFIVGGNFGAFALALFIGAAAGRKVMEEMKDDP